MLKDLLLCELQADEIRTFIAGKKQVSWVMTSYGENIQPNRKLLLRR